MACSLDYLPLIQIFVAMTPEETVYFANPGNGEPLKSEFQFHWADVNNEIIGIGLKLPERC